MNKYTMLIIGIASFSAATIQTQSMNNITSEVDKHEKNINIFNAAIQTQDYDKDCMDEKKKCLHQEGSYYYPNN